MKRFVLFFFLAAVSCGLYSKDVKPLSPEWMIKEYERSRQALAERIGPCCSDTSQAQFTAAEETAVLPTINAAAIDDAITVPLWSVDMTNGAVSKLYDIDGDGVFDAKVVFARFLLAPTALHLLGPYKALVYSVYGYVFTIEDTNRDGIADSFASEITDQTWGTAITTSGNLNLVSTYHPLGVMNSFRITDEGILTPRNAIIYGGAGMSALTYDATRTLYGVSPFYGTVARLRLPDFKTPYGFGEVVARVSQNRIYPTGLAFDQDNRMVVVSPELRYIDFSTGKEQVEPGKIAIIELTQDPYSPRVTILSQSRQTFSLVNGMTIQDTRTGGLRVYYTVNPSGRGQKARIEMREFDALGRLLKVTDALPPDLSGSDQLGNVLIKKWPIVLY